MRITYLLTTADARAGTERAIAEQTNAMSAMGHEVVVASVYRLDEPGFSFGDRVTVDYMTSLEGPSASPSLMIPTEWDSQFCLSTDAPIIDYLRRCTADVVVTTTPALTVFALHACAADIRIVQQEHRNSISRGVTGVPVLRHSPRVDALVVLTERSADWLAARFGDRAPRIEVIPNALPAIARPQSSVTQHVVMAAGRFVGAKGFVNLVRAFGRVADDYPDWRLRLFGEGPQRERILMMARNLGIAAQVEIFPPTDAIEKEWARASIGALASTSEGLPLVLMEARGAGLPLVAFDCETGPREIIRHGKDGYLVEPGDIAGFAGALRLLMEDEQKRVRMSQAAPESLERFDPGWVAEQWSELFEEVVAEEESSRQRLDRDAVVESRVPAEEAEEEAADSGRVEKSTAGPAVVGDGEPFDGTADMSVEEMSTALREASTEDSASGAQEDGVSDADGVLVIDCFAVDLVPRNARERNRLLLAELFEDLPLRCRPVSLQERTMWAIREQDRAEFLEAFIEKAPPSLEVRLYSGRTRLDQDGVSWRRDLDEVNLEDVTRIFLFHHFQVPGTTQHVGYAAGLAAHFWKEDEFRPGLFTSGGANDEFDCLRPEQFDQPLFAPWSPMHDRPLWSSIEFAIDAVYTWVDDSDDRWRERRAAAMDAVAPDDLAGGDIRFKNRDELKYSLRSLFAHAPWIRHVFIVTDGQYPAWLRKHPSVTVVDHKELFPDASVLPVFNSHAIETVLHRIPGLSEHFLYLNDDVFLMRDQRPDQYFTPIGQARMFVSPTKINDLGDLAEPHEAAAMNNRMLLERRHGVTITNGLLHTPYPHRRRVLEQICEQYPDVIERTRRSRFRSGTDISMTSSFAQHYGLFTGEYVQGTMRVGFISLGSPTMMRRLSEARGQNLDCLTFGEFAGDPSPELTQEASRTFMRTSFPIAAPWELPPDGAV
ncbi:stealth conserved region 3 domain-containing protein [Brachybacterium paraconglomeratum]|uniref:stealth conserved region 3 domain-containing protein n=1 Tax=Brachybacterium paraconglomeratum TaxID=173362 RepID=UPI0022E40106|nr:stealth conserved region 3 domain-containing protein [Brachybacterium paraconglomeratum]